MAASLNAAVSDSGPGGFTIQISYDVKGTPDDVYKKFVQNIGDWWNPDHTFSGDAHNLSIEAKPMGCFCEKMPKGGGVRHLEVITVVPGQWLVMSGGLGPMQSLAAAGTMTITLKSSTAGVTQLAMTYAVAGYLAKGMNAWAGPVDNMLTEQFTRFKKYVETGDPKSK